MKRIGRGDDVALWFNGRAKRVTPKVLDAYRAALPRARVFASETLEGAAQDAKALAAHPPKILFCGGGDGTAVVMLNALREAGVGPFPTLGLLKLGTGNGWPRATHAPPLRRTLERLPLLPLEPTTHVYDLMEVEGRLCHFAGAGWDAIVLRDYKQTLAARQDQIIAPGLSTRLATGVGGYLYSVLRRTVPGELTAHLKHGRVRVTVENLGEPALTVVGGHPVAVHETGGALFEGPLSVASAGTEPYWGGSFLAFPYARLVPGRMSVRVYTRNALVGVTSIPRLWTGAVGARGMNDFLLTKARLVFSRPTPFQIAGDVIGPRDALELVVAKETVDVIDWKDVE